MDNLEITDLKVSRVESVRKNEIENKNEKENSGGKSHVNKKKRKIKKTKHKLKPEIKLYIFIVVFSVIFIVLSFTLLFKIDNIYANECGKYSTQEIIEASGINHGDNLLLCNKSNACYNILNKFSYIENVEIKKKFPSSVEIITKTAEPDFAINADDSFFIVSKNGRILEKTYEKPENLIILKGVRIKSYNECDSMEYESTEVENNLSKIHDSLKENDINGINTIDVSNLEDIIINFDNRIDILIGNIEDLDYKFLTAKEIIENKLNDFEKGSLNVKDVKTSNKSYFSPR